MPVSCATLKRASKSVRCNCSPATPKTFKAASRSCNASTNCAPCASPDASPTTSMISFRGGVTMEATTAPSQLCTDHRGYFESPQAVRSAHHRQPARAHTLKKRVDFIRQRIAVFDFYVFGANIEPTGPRRGFVIDLRPPLVVIDRNISVRLEKSYFPFALERNPARGHVGNTAIGKIDPCVGDVRLVGQDRHAHRFDPLYR